MNKNATQVEGKIQNHLMSEDLPFVIPHHWNSFMSMSLVFSPNQNMRKHNWENLLWILAEAEDTFKNHVIPPPPWNWNFNPCNWTQVESMVNDCTHQSPVVAQVGHDCEGRKPGLCFHLGTVVNAAGAFPDGNWTWCQSWEKTINFSPETKITDWRLTIT